MRLELNKWGLVGAQDEVRGIKREEGNGKQLINIQVKVQYVRLGWDAYFTVFSWAEINEFKLRHSKSSEGPSIY